MVEEKVIGRYLLKGKLRVESPLLIGCSEKSGTDSPVLKDTEGIPYIPGTSLGGVLRHHFKRLAESGFPLEQVEKFWGSEKKEKNEAEKDSRSFQSSFFVSDLRPLGMPRVVVRDGIALDEQGVAKDKKKFDYEAIEPGIDFGFQAEVLLREAFEQETFVKIVALIMNSLEKGEVPLGSMTTKGFGRCRLLDAECLKFDFRKKADVLNWLAGETEKACRLEITPSIENMNAPNDLFIEVVLAIKNSLLIKSYSGRPQDPDAVHITSNGQAILPGTSIKGALRARAERIMNTLGGSADNLKKLFGWAPENREDQSGKRKSRFIVEESIIRETETVREQQTRIRIDCFTGGVINGALFNSMPIWPKDPTQPMVVIKMRIRDCVPWEAGLLMLVLKDLWTADLPIGGEKSIGRGVFTGITAKIRFENNEYIISENNGAPLIEGKLDNLENWVAAFHEFYGCKGAL
jgi:CRISPR/Cas system CSM-associated protein Csm3 (group 7 of RAMP superfamily)